MHKNSETRETLQEWLDSHGFDYPTKVVKTFLREDGQEINLKDLLGHLWHCTDILPASYCLQLDVPYGSTYAQAVRNLFKTMKRFQKQNVD